MWVRRRPRASSRSFATGAHHSACACGGAAQVMFSSTRAFNQPVEAWDVGQVTSMLVRCCPRGEPEGGGLSPPEHANLYVDANSACACGGAAQGMFYNAITFNQPVAAWDVGKVTAMRVRRRPRREPERLGWQFFATGALNRPARAVWRGAGRVQLRERFQPARGSVGRWPGHQNGCAPPPAAP